MRLVTYNKKELQEFIESDFFREMERIPISKHRAISHINNPFCSDDDILLWTAFDNNDLIGYVGVLPDIIEQEGKKEKIYWLSCFWVDETQRLKNVASVLFFPLIKLYGKQLFISNFLFSLEKTYQKLGIFQATQNNYGYDFYRNFDFAEKIKSRYPKLKFLMPFYVFFEKLFNSILTGFRKLFYRPLTVKEKVVENCEFDTELNDFLSAFSQTDNQIVRDTSYFNWVVNYPWILQGKENKDSKRYHFSSISQHFEYRSIKIYSSEKIVGFILLRIRNKHLTISFLYLQNDNYEDAANYILNIACMENLNVITTFDDRLSKSLTDKKRRFIYRKRATKKYIFPKNNPIESSVFQEGDGDSVFT